MAMMEHFCADCGKSIFNNSSVTEYCPKCGEAMQKIADEDFEKDEDYGHGSDYDDDEPDEEEDDE